MIGDLVWKALGGMLGVADGVFGAILAPFMLFFLTTAGWLVTASSMLFSILIEHVVVDFGGTMQTLGMMQGVQVAWTVFRDLGNIVIIGMFVFVAISIILGNEVFGAKRMIARVLLIAVLINFSFLLTTQIINVSNFVAYQFYQSASLASVGAASADGVPASGSIGQAFLDKSGLGSIYNYDIVSVIKTGWSKGIGFFAIYTFAGTVFILFLTGIFLYGSFLILARALLLVLLILTSALAFASYLIPNVAQTQYAWKGWWESLLKASLFAPLLMVLLWAVLLILSYAPRSSVSLADYIQNPTNASAWQIVFMYFFTAGLLYAVFKISSSFTSGIPHFGLMSSLLATPLAVASRMGGLLGRNLLGRAGMGIEKALGADLSQARRLLARMKAANAETPGSYSAERIAEVEGMMKRLEFRKGIASRFSKADYNLMNTKSAQWLAKQTGISGFVDAGKTVGGFAASAKKAADAAAARAESALLSQGDQNKIREEAQKDMAYTLNQERQQLERQQQTAEAILRATQQQSGSEMQVLHQQKQAAEQQARLVEQQARVMKETLQAEIEQIRKDLTHAVPGTQQEAQMKAELARKQSAISAEDDNIRRAHEAVKEIETRLQAHKDNILFDEENVRKAQRALQEHDNTAAQKIADHAEKTVRAAVEQGLKTGSKLAGEYGSDIVSRYLGRTSLKGSKAQDTFDEKHRPDRFKKDLEKLIQQMQNPGSSPPNNP